MKKMIRTVVIDYSDTQRKLINLLVDRNPCLELIGSCKNAYDAILCLNDAMPDLVLLDIEMPDLNGFEFLDRLSGHTQVILITATPDYALKAFDLGVTDYLLKPVSAARFHVAIDKAWSNCEFMEDKDKQVPSLQVRSDHEMKRIALSDIRWIEALGDYVKIVTNNEHFLILSTMKSIEESLPGDKFLRIHRSYIVNLKKVENFSNTSVGIEGNELPMSRAHKTELEEILLPVE